MKTKAMQVFWLILATLFVAGILFFVTDSVTVTTIAGTFTGIVGVFLGLDILTMIHKTRELPCGAYKNMNRHRYILALCIFAALLLEAFIISGLYGREMNALYLCFGVGFIIVIGGLISGVEANKIATDVCVKTITGTVEAAPLPPVEKQATNSQSVVGNGNQVAGGSINNGGAA